MFVFSWFGLIFWLISIRNALAFSFGAPLTACSSMAPSHDGKAPQNSTPPYKIKFSQFYYEPGDTLNITITGSYYVPVRGFLLMMKRVKIEYPRKINEIDDHPIGNWELARDTVTCCTLTSPGHNALTHTVPYTFAERNFTWTAPSKSEGHLRLYATIVASGKLIFWVKVPSDILCAGTADYCKNFWPTTTTTTSTTTAKPKRNPAIEKVATTEANVTVVPTEVVAEDSSKTAIIILAVTGSVCFLVVLGGLVFIWFMCKRHRDKRDRDTYSNASYQSSRASGSLYSRSRGTPSRYSESVYSSQRSDFEPYGPLPVNPYSGRTSSNPYPYATSEPYSIRSNPYSLRSGASRSLYSSSKSKGKYYDEYELDRYRQ